MKSFQCGKAILAVAIMLLCLSTNVDSVGAAKFNRVLDIGKQAPAWKNLRGTDGKSHSLSDLKKAKAVIVMFTCNHCPVAQAYENRLIKLAQESRKKGVETVAISLSRLEADNLEAMKKRSTEKKYPFAYLQDTSQKTGKDYGALSTPHVFLLDSKRRIAYMGRLDDSLYPDKVQKRFLQDAIDAVLKGDAVEIGETKPIGCPIDYD